MFREEMITAIRTCRLVRLTYDSKEKGIITRKCVPFDIGPSSREKTGKEYYHFYDLDSPDGKHNLPAIPERIRNLEVLNERFDPADYVKWTPNWHIKRDWGKYS